MATSGKGTGIVGYNVQAAVDAEHHLIVAHAVTNVGSDRAQLVPMGLWPKRRRDAPRSRCWLNGLPQRGSSSGVRRQWLLPCVPKTLTSGHAKLGLFTGQDFIYDAEKDHYTCPAGQHLTKGVARSDRRPRMTRWTTTVTGGLRGLHAQTPLHTCEDETGQALGARRRARCDAQERLDRMPGR